MTNKNQEAFKQMQRLTQAAKNFYGNNYNPGSLYPPKDTKFFLNEEYIPFDFDTDYDDPLYKKYRRVRMLDNPFEDIAKEDNDTNFTTGLDNETYATSVKNDKTKLPIYKEIANKIWDKHASKLPGYESGQFIADAKIAYDHWRDMNKTNRALINKYGKGAARGTDDYYHALLQCQLAKLSEADRINGLWMGYAKEMPFDYFRKRLSGMSDADAEKDGLKDLQNNLNGSNMGAYNKNTPCYISLGHLITENMKNANIK